MNEENKSTTEQQESELPLWVQWTLAGIALALGVWFGWMMF